MEKFAGPASPQAKKEAAVAPAASFRAERK
jgi:hypothetical protein